MAAAASLGTSRTSTGTSVRPAQLGGAEAAFTGDDFIDSALAAIANVLGGICLIELAHKDGAA